jgi:hypothetical protein
MVGRLILPPQFAHTELSKRPAGIGRYRELLNLLTLVAKTWLADHQVIEQVPPDRVDKGRGYPRCPPFNKLPTRRPLEARRERNGSLTAAWRVIAFEEI